MLHAPKLPTSSLCLAVPCIRDMKKPITVLTGMDYWLDNLMSNVPELVMCFHVDGIVKVDSAVHTIIKL